MQPGDLTQLATVKQWLGLTGLAVSAITNANPAVLTLQTRPATPLLSGVAYRIEGSTGMVLPAGDYVVTVIDPTNFSIPYDTTANGTYTGGAVVSITDPILSRLITACSRYIQNWLNRTIASATYIETRNGLGTSMMALDNFPVLNVTMVTVDGISIPPRPPLGAALSGSYTFNGTPGGYVFSDIAVMIANGVFCRGYQNVVISYSAGFQVSNEAQTVPADPGPYTLTTIGYWSAGNRGVRYPNGAVLTQVTTPTVAGEYSVDGSTYTFSAGDAGADVLLSYAYVPPDVEQAAVDTVGDWFKYIDRVGKTSQAIENQSTQFTNIPLPTRAKDVLQQYKKVAPIV
jgi:hypothetical protein